MALDPEPGLTVVEIINAASASDRRAYVMGENPAMSDPDVDHRARFWGRSVISGAGRSTSFSPRRPTSPTWCCWRRRGLRADRIVTKTPIARCSSDAGDRAAGRGSRPDLWTANELARGMGLDWHYSHPPRRVQRDAPVHGLDCRAASPGTGSSASPRSRTSAKKRAIPDSPWCSSTSFPAPHHAAAHGLSRPISFRRAERPDEQYPLRAGSPDARLSTGTRRLDDLRCWYSTIDRAGTCRLCSSARSRGGSALAGRETLTIELRRGAISLYALAPDDGMLRGAVFVPFCYYEAAANNLTQSRKTLDPFVGKIQIWAYCAVRVLERRICAREAPRSFGGVDTPRGRRALIPHVPR